MSTKVVMGKKTSTRLQNFAYRKGKDRRRKYISRVENLQEFFQGISLGFLQTRFSFALKRNFSDSNFFVMI